MATSVLGSAVASAGLMQGQRPFSNNRVGGSTLRGVPLLQRRVAKVGRILPGAQTVTARLGGKASTAQAYICKDCGYIYDERQAFDKLPSDYRCPVCQAPKRRFGPYNAPVAKGANSMATRKARKAELQSGGGGAGINPAILAGVGAAALVVLYVALNSTFSGV